MSKTPANTYPWSDTSQTALERAEKLLSAMTSADKVNLVMGNTDALTHLGIPSLERVDASCGLRGDTGVTAFPVPIALSATFDTELAYAFGAAIAEEAREHGWSIILGPTVDVERRGNSGRLPEGYGEDPLLNGLIGDRVSQGMIDHHTIPCLKHFTAYNQETNRRTVDIRVSNRALHEIYNKPFYIVIQRGHALSMMGSYPKINGTHACENAEVMDDLRKETDWQGFMMPDFMAGEDPVAGFNAGMDTTTLYPKFPADAFTDGQISPERLDQAVRRMLFAIFESGLFEHPVGALDQKKMVSTPAHKALAQRTAEQSMVLLKNKDNLLPLSSDNPSLAIIGCADHDAITGVEGSTYVIPENYQTPLNAIKSAVGNDDQIIVAQGSHGDHPLPIVPANALITPDGTTEGLLGTIYANTDFSGEPVAEQVTATLDFSAPPIEGLPPAWSARWTGKITSPVTGIVNFSILCTGSIKLYIDGQCIISGHRDVTYFITKGYYFPLHGSINMTANQPVDIVVELSSPLFPLDFVMGKHLHLGWQPHQWIPEAVDIAQQADTAIVFVNQAVGEGMDRDSFRLPADQNHLIEAVSAVNPNTIVILNTPGGVVMPWIDQVASVLQVWYPGEAVGTALASVLFGKSEPGGRLPLTFPSSEDQTLPAYSGEDYIDYDEDVFVGYRHYQKQQLTPLFSFGYGLSYTEFDYSDVLITPLEDAQNIAMLTVTVRNTGERYGSDVIQVYVGELPAPVPTPPKQLAGFAKVTLNAKESTTIDIFVSRQSISYWDESAKTWQLSQGNVTLYIGNSSADDRLSATLNI